MPELRFRIELSGDRLALYEALFRRSERIARMYLGAHYALRDAVNPERLADRNWRRVAGQLYEMRPCRDRPTAIVCR